MHQRQAIHQYSHVIAVGVCPCLFKLVDNLHLIASKLLFINKINIL